MRSIAFCLVAAAMLAAASAGSTKDAEGFQWELRKKTGHFGNVNDLSLQALYNVYSTALLLPAEMDTVARDHTSHYTADGQHCMLFLGQFVENDYQVQDMHEVVPLDGCLGYLFDKHACEYHEADKQKSSVIERELPRFVEDKRLRALYDNTQLESFDETGRTCVGNLMLDAIRLKKQFPDVVCNNHWIDAYTHFADCQKFEAEKRKSDSYLELIFDLLRARAKVCFDNEIALLNEAVRNRFRRAKTDRLRTSVMRHFSSAVRQADDRMWPQPIVDVLMAVQMPDHELNLHEIHDTLHGIEDHVGRFSDRFLANMAKFANQRISTKKAVAATDPTGAERYKTLVNDICKYFRPSDSEHYYDFATAVRRLVRLLDHQDIFGISENSFLAQTVSHGYESAPLYFAVCSCNIMTFTQASFEMKPQNGKKNLVVRFVRDTAPMIQWPHEKFY